MTEVELQMRGIMMNSSINGVGENDYPYGEKNKLHFYLPQFTKLDSRKKAKILISIQVLGENIKSLLIQAIKYKKMVKITM